MPTISAPQWEQRGVAIATGLFSAALIAPKYASEYGLPISAVGCSGCIARLFVVDGGSLRLELFGR